MGGAQAVDLKFSLVSIGIKLKNYFPHLSLPPSFLSQMFLRAQHMPSTEPVASESGPLVLVEQGGVVLLNLEGSGPRAVSWSSSRKCREAALWPGPPGALLLALRTGLRLGE